MGIAHGLYISWLLQAQAGSFFNENDSSAYYGWLGRCAGVPPLAGGFVFIVLGSTVSAVAIAAIQKLA